MVPQLEADRYYRWLTYAVVPLHFVALIGCAVWAGTQDLPLWAFFVLAYVAGTTSGLGINTGHELGHKHTVLEQWLAKLVLAVPAYGHFRVEHNRGHHRFVATPEDHASARMGESIYRFALRELPGGMRRAWSLEAERLRRAGPPPGARTTSCCSPMPSRAVLQGTLIVFFGWMMLPFLLIHNLVAWWQLTSANYVEHYGLLRLKGPDGELERCQPHHSWNANTPTPTWCCSSWSGTPTTMPTPRGVTNRCATSRTCRNCPAATSACSRWPMCRGCGSR